MFGNALLVSPLSLGFGAHPRPSAVGLSWPEALDFGFGKVDCLELSFFKADLPDGFS